VTTLIPASCTRDHRGRVPPIDDHLGPEPLGDVGDVLLDVGIVDHRARRGDKVTLVASF
jgi:hypothetical protein